METALGTEAGTGTLIESYVESVNIFDQCNSNEVNGSTDLQSNIVGNILERLADSIDGTSSFEDDTATGTSLPLELGLGAPVNVTNELVHGLLELLARG